MTAVSSGHDKHCLVLLPGLDGTGEFYAPLRRCLGDRFDVIVVDYPDLENLAAYVNHAQAFLPRDRAFSLIAESFSGPVAIAVMATGRWRVASAVLSATFARPPRPLLSRLSGLVPPAVFGIDALQRLGLEHFGLNGGDYPEVEWLASAIMQRLDPAVLRRRAMLLRDIDVSELLAGIELPVLCLRAGRDRVVGAKHAELLLSALPAARGEVVDAPHLLLQCEPQTCADLAVRHIRSIARL